MCAQSTPTGLRRLHRDGMVEFQRVLLLGCHKQSFLRLWVHLVGTPLHEAQVPTHQVNREPINHVVGDVVEIVPVLGHANVAVDNGGEGGQLFLGELFHLLGAVPCPLDLVENGPLSRLPVIAHGSEGKLDALCGLLLNGLVLDIGVGGTLDY